MQSFHPGKPSFRSACLAGRKGRKPSCVRSGQHSKPPNSLVQMSKGPERVSGLPKATQQVNEGLKIGKQSSQHPISGKGLRGGTRHSCHSSPGWGPGTAHTLDSSGSFFGPESNSCCCRPGLGMVSLVPSSLFCCLRMAKIKVKQASEPVLKKNWRPRNRFRSRLWS